MLKPAFALVSMKMTLRSRAFESPSSMETCLQFVAGWQLVGRKAALGPCV